MSHKNGLAGKATLVSLLYPVISWEQLTKSSLGRKRWASQLGSQRIQGASSWPQRGKTRNRVLFSSVGG